MQANGQAGLNHSGLYQLDQICAVGICAGALGNLQNNRSIALLGGFRDPLNDFHVVYIEGADGITALIRFFKHLS